MRKLLSFAVILSLLLSFAFPVAQTGTVTQKVQAAINKIDYITAGEFVTSLLVGAKVKPDGAFDYWGKAVKMGLIPQEVKKDKPITRAQASYIVWKLINAVPELRDKNIPVRVEVLSPVDYTFYDKGDPTKNFRGAYIGIGKFYYSEDRYRNFNVKNAIMMYDLVILDKYYKDGSVKTVHVWNRIKGYYLPLDWDKLLQRFMKECPNDVKFNLPEKRLKNIAWCALIDAGSAFGTDLKQEYKEYIIADNPQLYKLYKVKPDKSWFGKYAFIGFGKKNGRYALIGTQYFEYGKYKSKDPKDWLNTVELHPLTNEALNKWLMKLPRKFPLDYTRFKYICQDFDKVPSMYQEAVLRLLDLGIIQPDANVYDKIYDIGFGVEDKDYKGIYKPCSTFLATSAEAQILRPPEMKKQPDIKINAGKTVTKQEALSMIERALSEEKRIVFDELVSEFDVVDETGRLLLKRVPYMYLDVPMFYHSGKTVTFRIDELWQLMAIKNNLTKEKNIANINRVITRAKADENILPTVYYPLGIVHDTYIVGFGPMSPYIPLYDGLR